uniref:Secreted protein n=1 Tax=Cucumis melo TaxID=3656 RepID=A0A9I9EIG8_CUCME
MSPLLLPLLPTPFLAISVSSSNFSMGVHPNTKPYLSHSFFLSLFSLSNEAIRLFFFRVLFLDLNATSDFDPFRSLGVFVLRL